MKLEHGGSMPGEFTLIIGSRRASHGRSSGEHLMINIFLTSELKFGKLIQGNMTLAEYEAKFMRLQRFTSKLVASEEMRADRFF